MGSVWTDESVKLFYFPHNKKMAGGEIDDPDL